MDLTFDQYSTIVDETCVVSPELLPFYAPLGLVGEAAELAAYGANSAAAAGEDLAETVLTMATLVGEIAEATKKHKYRGDKTTDTETFKATVIGSCMDIIDLCTDLFDQLAGADEEFDEYMQDVQDVLALSNTRGPARNRVFVTKQPEDGECKEAGDVLWYLAACAKTMGFTLETAASVNREKLRRRLSEGKIQGNGSDR